MGNACPPRTPFEGEAPAVTTGKFYPIVRAIPGGKIQGWAINPCVHGVWCHYLDRRTQPCQSSLGGCQACQDKVGKRWYGYVPYLQPVSGKIALAELTAEAALSCPTLTTAGANLRGQFLIIERIGQSRRSRCRVMFEERAGAGQLPQPVDTARALMRIWGMYAKPAGLPVERVEGSAE